MARSWFYLTLWRGTPPEFTSKAETAIDTGTRAAAAVQAADASQVRITTRQGAAAAVRTAEHAARDIITTTEVIWRVGRAEH